MNNSNFIYTTHLLTRTNIYDLVTSLMHYTYNTIYNTCTACMDYITLNVGIPFNDPNTLNTLRQSNIQFNFVRKL